MENSLNHKNKLIKWVKIRIGEPITALKIGVNIIAFGSISGYIGKYCLKSQKITYGNTIYEEIIRDITLNEKNDGCILVGDLKVIKKNFNELIQEENSDKVYHLPHDKDDYVCFSSMTMIRNNKIILFNPTPGVNKEPDQVYGVTKRKFCIYSLEKQEKIKNQEETKQLSEQKHDIQQCNLVKEWKIPNDECPIQYTPFNYDGEKLLILEHFKNKDKEFKIVNPEQQSISGVTTIDKTVKYISLAYLLNNWIIYVENKTTVKGFDMQKHSTKTFYSQKKEIQQICVKCYTYSELNPNQILTGEDLEIASFDIDCQFILYKQLKIKKQINLKQEIQGYPEEIKRHYKIFDLGYPYLIQYENDILAITCDLGILIFQL